MKNNKSFNACVDAGNISIADLSYIEKNGGMYGESAKECCSRLEVDPGKYEVSITIHNTWEGILKESILIETKGTIVVGDICYLFSSGEPSDSNWMPFLKKTDYLEKHNNNFHSISTGGDGRFVTEYSLKRRNK